MAYTQLAGWRSIQTKHTCHLKIRRTSVNTKGFFNNVYNNKYTRRKTPSSYLLYEFLKFVLIADGKHITMIVVFCL